MVYPAAYQDRTKDDKEEALRFVERSKGCCGQKMQYREVGILTELCLKMPYKVLMVCRRLPPCHLMIGHRHARKAWLVSVHDSVMESVIVNPKTALPDLCSVWLWEWRKTRAMAQSWGLQLSIGGAQHWSPTKGPSPLSVTVEKLALSKCLWLSPRPVASDATEVGCWLLVSRSDKEWESFTLKHNLAQLFWSLWELTCSIGQGAANPTYFLFLKFTVYCKVVIRMTSVRMCPFN